MRGRQNTKITSTDLFRRIQMYYNHTRQNILIELYDILPSNTLHSLKMCVILTTTQSPFFS